jgi:hypothetical protein
MKVMGLYDWSGNNPIIPELWLLPYFLPIHPGTCFLVSQYNYLRTFVLGNVPHTEGFEDKLEKWKRWRPRRPASREYLFSNH